MAFDLKRFQRLRNGLWACSDRSEDARSLSRALDPHKRQNMLWIQYCSHVRYPSTRRHHGRDSRHALKHHEPDDGARRPHTVPARAARIDFLDLLHAHRLSPDSRTLS